MNRKKKVRKGDVFLANLDPTVGVEIKKTRPVIVVSNNVINKYSPLVVVVPLTTNISKVSPSHVVFKEGIGGLNKPSKVLTEQIRAMDKQRLHKKLGSLRKDELKKLEDALKNTLDM